MDYPCRGCLERSASCHGSCERYLAAREAYNQRKDAEWESRSVEMLTDHYQRKAIQRIKKRRE